MQHVERLPDIGASASDEALAFPLTGLAGEAGERCGLLVLAAAKLGHCGDELIGGQRSHAGDAGEDLVPAGECCVGGDEFGDLGIERFDMPTDLLKPLPTLALEQGDGEVFLAVLERGPVTHQAIAGIDKLGHLDLLRGSCAPDLRLQGGSHPGQQHGIDAIGLGDSAGRLSEAPGTFRIELHTGPVGKCSLQRPVVGAGCLIGDPINLPLPEPGDEGFDSLGGVGKPALDAGGLGMAIEARFGDVPIPFFGPMVCGRSLLIFSDVPCLSYGPKAPVSVRA